MAGEWPETALSDLTEPDTPVTYGVVKPGEADPDGVWFIRGGDISGGRILWDQLRTITHKVSRQYQRTLLRGGEIVMSLVGNPGQVAVVPESLSGANIARQAALIRLRKDVDTRFVMYFLGSRTGQEALRAHSRGSVQQVINLRDLKTVRIPTPPLYEQRAIANILGALDDKIELNRRMNETLEEMARAIFKSWFVDFEPVRAKAEGRDPGLPKHIADLFPDRFEGSELGEIPAGWATWCVADVGNVICGKTPSTKVAEYYGDAIPFITIPDMRGKVFAKNVQRRLSHSGAASQPKKALPAGSICVSCIATPGLVVITSEESHINQQINAVVPKDTGETYFWFWIFRNLGDQIASGGSGGSVFANLSTGRFSKLSVLAPHPELRRNYHLLVKPLFDRILRNDGEIDTLAAIRDALLPRLISGELRVPDASRYIEVGL